MPPNQSASVPEPRCNGHCAKTHGAIDLENDPRQLSVGLWFENRAAQRFQCGIVWLGTERTDVDRVVDTSGISNVA